MLPMYLHQLLKLGIHPSQLPSGEINERISGSEPFFVIDIQPDTTPGKTPGSDPTPDGDFNVAFYYALDTSTHLFHLTHYVATLYSEAGDIYHCRTFPIIK